MKRTESQEVKIKRTNLPLRTLHQRSFLLLRLLRSGRYYTHISGKLCSCTKEIREARMERLESQLSSWEG